MFQTEIIKKHSVYPARVTRITTAHGSFLTPAFMAVGTRAFVNSLSVKELREAGSQIILGGNTYHMLCHPGLERIQALGGMHAMMDWQAPMLTDSGGYQVFSLSRNHPSCRIDEEGAHFKHPQSGQVIDLTPEHSIKAQKCIGADIIMAFDQCTPDVADKSLVLAIMHRTWRWLERSKIAHDQHPASLYGFKQALFGILQGGSFQDLREACVTHLLQLDFDGIALGGEAIGFDMPSTCLTLDWVRPLLPEQKTVYTMGVGLQPQDLIDVVAKGADIFDCVAPTRNARHGSLYSGHLVEQDRWLKFESEYERAKISIKKSIYAKDERPIMESCDCYTCLHHSRAYLHYLFKEQSTLYITLACIHNIRVMNHVCERLQAIILQDTLKKKSQ